MENIKIDLQNLGLINNAQSLGLMDKMSRFDGIIGLGFLSLSTGTYSVSIDLHMNLTITCILSYISHAS